MSQQEYDLQSRHLKEHFQHLQRQFDYFYDEMAEAYQTAKRFNLGKHGKNHDQDIFCRDFKGYLVEVLKQIFGTD